MSKLRAHLAAPLYRNAYLLIVGAGISSAFGFVFWAAAARRYPEAVVGTNSAVVSAMMLVSGICQLGLNAVLVRYIPRAGASTRRFIIGTYGVAGVLSLVVAAGAALTSHLWSSKLEFLGHEWRWFVVFVVATGAWTIFTLQDSVMTGMRQTRWVAIENPAFAVTKVAMLLALVSVAPRSGIFVAWTLPVVISLVPINALIFRRLIPQHVEQPVAASWDPRRILRFASGNYFGTLFFLCSTVLVPILVTDISGTRAAAHFYIPWTIATGLQSVALFMTTSLMVEVAFDETKLRAYCRKVLVQTARIVVPLSAVLFVAAPYVLRLIGSAYAHDGVPLLRLLVVATIPNILVALGISVARLQHHGIAVLAIQGAHSVMTVVLSIVLLRHQGIGGVGLALLLSQVVVALGLTFGMLRPVLFGAPHPVPRGREGHATTRKRSEP